MSGSDTAERGQPGRSGLAQPGCAAPEDRVGESAPGPDGPLRDLLESLQVVVYRFDLGAGRLVYVSPSVEAVLGYSPEQIANLDVDSIAELVHPDDRERVQRELSSLLQSPQGAGARVSVELRARHRDGRYVWVGMRQRLVPGEHGGMTSLVGAAGDITVRKQAEDALRESEARYRTLFERTLNPQLVIDTNGNYIECNEAALRFLECTRDQLLTKNVRDFLLPDGDPATMEKHGLLWIEGGVIETEYRVRGRIKVLELAITPATWEGRPVVYGLGKDITERRRAETALRESEARYRELAESVTDLFFAMDRDLRYTYWNRRSEELTGIRAEEALGKSLCDIFPDVRDTTVERSYREAIRTGQPQHFTNHFEVRGRWHDFEMHAYPSPRGLSVIARDITDRVRAELELRDSERFLADVFSSIQDGISILDADMTIVRVNPAVEKLFAHSMPLVGKKCREAYHCPVEPCQVCPSRRTLDTGRAAFGVVPLQGPGGQTTMWLDLFAFPLLDAGTGEIRGVILYMRDVTQRKRAEEALRDSERQFRLIAESASDMISLHLLDDMSWLYANPATAQATGYSAEELAATRITDLVHPDDRDCARRAFAEGVRTGLASAQVRLRRKDGSYMWVEARGTPATDAKGRHVALIISRDITERKWREEQMARRAERLSGQLAERYHMVGQSAPMCALYEFIRKVAPTDAGVLICGESGTGKEVVARAVHEQSRRADGPFEVVNCAAMPPTLLESELFGHVRGAFTGAVADKPGRFELADGGTLFLDEVVELPVECQTKLLRVLEEGSVRRVGDTRDRRVDVRLVAATNRDVDRALAEGRLRPDLFYRLDRLRVQVPPLRERTGDVDLLAQYFLEQLSVSCRRDVEGFTADVLAAFRAYGWPGNVRELRNVIERMVLLSEGRQITLGDIPADLLSAAERAVGAAVEPLAEVERKHILRVLAEAGGNKKRAAQMLGIDRSTLYARLKSYGLKP
jgi:PAS domain S-box-containing protein